MPFGSIVYPLSYFEIHSLVFVNISSFFYNCKLKKSTFLSGIRVSEMLSGIRCFTLLLLLSLSSRRCVDSPSNLFIFPARNSKRERRPRCVVQHLRYSNQFGTVCCVLCLGCVAELHLFFDWRRKRAIWYFPPGSIWHESLAIDRERWVEWFDFSVDGANSKWEFVSPPKRTNKRKTKSVAWMYL
jgi:hypothetical protein